MSLQRIEEVFVSASLAILILLVFISATLRWFGLICPGLSIWLN